MAYNKGRPHIECVQFMTLAYGVKQSNESIVIMQSSKKQNESGRPGHMKSLKTTKGKLYLIRTKRGINDGQKNLF